MDKSYPLSSPMLVQPLDMKNDSFFHHEKDKNLLGLEVPYLSAICALMYLANCTVQIFFFCQFISWVQFYYNSKTL